MAYEPHPGSDPQSDPMTYKQMPARNKRPESNQISDHLAGNAYSGSRYYSFEHGNDNAFTQPTSGLTDVDVGFPPMNPKYDAHNHTEDIVHGRSVIGRPKVPALPDRPAEARRPWTPKGRSADYRSAARSRRGKGSQNAGPGGSMGYNT